MTRIINQRKHWLRRIRNFSLVLLLIYLLGLTETVTGLNNGRRALRKCSGFKDQRSNLDRRPDGFDINELTIPANLSSRGENLHFILKPGDELNCNEEIYLINITFEDNLAKSPPQNRLTNLARNFGTVERANIPLSTHFTSDGHFFDGKYFLSPETDYCVNSISQDKLELLFCPQKCDGGSESKVCFPKCCGLDEVFLWKECVKLNETMRNDPYWNPELYRKQWHGGYSKVTPKNIKFFLAPIPSDCNNGDGQGAWFKQYSTVALDDPSSKYSTPKDFVRLVLDKNGNVQPASLHHLRREWVIDENVGFCADAVVVTEGGKAGSSVIKPEVFWYFLCSPPDDDQVEVAQTKAWSMSTVYTVFSFISIPFQLLTVAIYLILLDKLNLHGLTILSYSVAEFMAFTLLIMAQLVYLNGWTWIGIQERGWPCYLNAISAHFFLLSSCTWLLVMNFDLWIAFRSLRVVKSNTKELKKFLAYSLFAWGLPLILIFSFIIVDEVYRDPTTMVPVPNYGSFTCFVAPNFRGLYVFLPIGILISFNIVLIILTLKIFVDARRQNKATLGDSSARVNAAKYSAKLFARLFVLMGGSSLISFLSWYYTDSQEKTPWTVVILESLSYLVPIVLFFLFCMNEKILRLLQEKFPRFKELLKPLWKIFKGGEDETANSADTTLTTNSSTSKEEKRRLKSTSQISYE